MELDKDMSDSADTVDIYSGDHKFITGFWTQYKTLTKRTFSLARPRIFDKLKIMENLLICAMFSFIWFQLPRTEDTIRDRMGAVSKYFMIHKCSITSVFINTCTYTQN